MKKTLKKRRKTQIPHNATVIWGKITINSQQNGGFWSPVKSSAQRAPPAHRTHNHPLPPHKVTYMASRVEDTFASYKRQRLIDGLVYVLTSTCCRPTFSSLTGEIFSIFSATTSFQPNLQHFSSGPFAFNVCDNKANTLTQSQMLKDPDRSNFIGAQAAEVKGLNKMDVFEVLPFHTKPPRAKLLNTIWSYRRKRSPVGTILKHKARLCVDDSQQLHGRDFWETYAPVVSWSTVCLLLLWPV
jgi:hypothetical protein